MSDRPTPFPNGVPRLVPHLIIDGASNAIAWYADVFGAELLSRVASSSGRILHAELRIGGGHFYISDRFEAARASEPVERSIVIQLWADTEELWPRAVRAGARERLALSNRLTGDRYGELEDPFGHIWALSERVEIVTADELEARMRRAAPDRST